ncbi:YacP-like NYN domain protein [Quillaja saponaria]|nr:YacP-like NYN domain protein [Quillaja saponaria]
MRVVGAMKTVPSSSSSLLIPLTCPGSSSGGGSCFASCTSTTTSYKIVAARNKKQPQTSKGCEPTPPRITSNVKQNLQFLKLWKEFQRRKSSTPRPSTSYRRKKVDKEDLPEDTEVYRDPTITLYYTNQGIDNAVPVLLVDGYNVCGYWMKLKKHFMNGRLDIARQKLIDELVTFSMLREVKVVAVFDAMMSGLPTHKETFNGVDVVFSAESCADTWIEKEVVALREDGCPKVWVVTSDHCHQHAAHGAGAFVWTCKALVSEIKASHKEVEQMLQEQRSTSFQGRLLKHNLDSEVVDALKDLRQKLSENES